MMLLAHQVAKATPGATALFTEVFPIALRKAKAQGAGVCSFILYGEGGGAWTIDLAARTVMIGAKESTDFHLSILASEFQRLLNGQLDPDNLDQRFFSFTGDPGVLAQLSSLLKIKR